MDVISLWKAKKKRKILWAAAAATALVLTGCGAAEETVVLSFPGEAGDVFVINESPCTESQIRLLLSNFKNIYGKAYDMDLSKLPAFQDRFCDYVREVTLSEAARIISMDKLAEDRGYVLTEEDVEKAGKAAEEYLGTLNSAEMDYIAFSDEKEEVQALYEHYALAQKLYDGLTGAVEVEVSEDEARVQNLLVIFVTEEPEAKEIEGQLNEGTDFATLAAQYTEGDAIEMNVNRTQLPEAVTEEAFRLDTGGWCGPVEAAGGYYFLLCNNKNVEELTQTNRQLIAKQREKAAFDDVYEAFAADLNSTVNMDLWNSIAFPEDDKITTNAFFDILDSYFG